MTEYKLLKDMPSLSAGAVFRLNEKNKRYYCVYAAEGQKTDWSFTQEIIETYTEWFKKIE